MRRKRRHSFRSFTLVELVISMAVATILLAGLTSAVILAAQALPGKERLADKLLQQARVLDQLVGELQYALFFAERGTRAITFTVADRNGDGSPERIRYAWSGTAGDPLTRQYNGGTVVSVLENVHQFNLGYDLKSATESYAGLWVEGAEELVNSHVSLLLLSDFSVESTKWIGQYFTPSAVAFPVGQATWRLTRVQYQARRTGPTDGQMQVEVRTPNSDFTPSSTVLEAKTVLESSLGSSYAWVESVFDTVTGLNPGEGLCLVFAYGAGGAKIAQLQYHNAGGSDRLTTANSGSSWTLDSSRSLNYRAYGAVSTPGPDQTITRQYVNAVRVTLQAGADATSQVTASARALNTPEVLDGYWEADFSANPTVLDVNADGVGDWVRRDGQPFNAATLSGGVWDVDNTLDSQPNCDFTALTTIDLRLRNTSTIGDPVVFTFNADWVGSNVAPLLIRLQRKADGTQTLRVYGQTDTATDVKLAQAAGLQDFVTLRLLIDPGRNSVNVRVNGTEVGTFAYYTFNAASYNHFASLLADTTGLDVDYVRIRVGGS
ncbi:MAG TPA: prepilin-type N-terminal cleavage/methylation domain-containing protein [Phycisphaerae bacterium]|nr:prepilin-type N-terminal cleavage/methylation domain-containing protein [Phycisphaerae bacterium]